MQVPYEALRRSAKERKTSMEEVNSIIQLLDRHDSSAATTAQHIELLKGVANQLHDLKQKVSGQSASIAANVQPNSQAYPVAA